MAFYTLTESAQADLREIKDFYRSISNEAVSNRRISQIYYRVELLASFPLLGIARSGDVSGLRSYPVPRSTITILYYPRDGFVEIVRVIIGSHNLERVIQ